MKRFALLISIVALAAFAAAVAAKPTSSLNLCAKGVKLYQLTPGRSCRRGWRLVQLRPAAPVAPIVPAAAGGATVTEQAGDPTVVAGPTRLAVSCPTGSRPITGWTESDVNSSAPDLIVGTWTISGTTFVMWTMPAGNSPVTTRLRVVCLAS